ncbi:MAG: signal recognition particle-docking protein FtsY [Euryarchaeota archaeon]|nr:signal recognition particle-docking protein FtsY [Euryarchaeota archaeon]MBJ29049.1 signal recognition particle-docking protein FtsY [Euryarchaeota archaeon]|tara:strand:- start:546 stop:1790 length:1245 start_codon:yes stop_codon:yes gene_type:complete
MGLFDRFRKRIEEAEEEKAITAEEGSIEAKKATNSRSRNLKKKTSEYQETASANETEWDAFDEEVNDPFAKPSSPKERKKAQREKSIKSQRIKPLSIVRNSMHSTTGRKLVKSGKREFEIDLGEDIRLRGGRVIKDGPVLQQLLVELEEELLSTDMSHTAVTELLEALTNHLVGSRVNRKANLAQVVENALRGALLSLLGDSYWDFDRTIHYLVQEETPVVIMMVGVNGTGKTTTSAKIAKRMKEQGYEVVLAAADTFRAGAIDQLAAHAERLEVRCIKSQRGGDSAAVARDAIESARAKGEDIVIVDTSGRMQNKSNLMEELRKVHRVTNPHLVIFVADALAGNDAVTQAVEFHKKLSFDGAALCKLDTDAKGGAALSISHATGRPIVLAGTGQGYGDLSPFDPSWLVDDLLS